MQSDTHATGMLEAGMSDSEFASARHEKGMATERGAPPTAYGEPASEQGGRASHAPPFIELRLRIVAMITLLYGPAIWSGNSCTMLMSGPDSKRYLPEPRLLNDVPHDG